MGEISGGRFPIVPDATLADLYDPTTMPPVLAKAHADRDRAVDRCYRKEPFPHDRPRRTPPRPQGGCYRCRLHGQQEYGSKSVLHDNAPAIKTSLLYRPEITCT